MTPLPPPTATRYAELAYALALRVLHKHLDPEYGRDAREMFRDRARAAAAVRGTRGVVFTLLRALADLIRVWSEARSSYSIRPDTQGIHMSLLTRLLQDCRQAVRSVSSQKATFGTAVVILAFGVGACAAMYSVISGVLLQPLAYDRPDGLVSIDLRTAMDTRSLSRAEIADLRSLRSFSAVGGAEMEEVYLTGGAEARWIAAGRVTHDVFAALGVQPALGRVLTALDDESDRRNVVISHRLWTTEFGGRMDVLGRSAQVDGEPHRIVGVMPATFRLPWDLNMETPSDLWRPLPVRSSDPRTAADLDGLGRLNPTTTLAQAQAELDTFAAALGALHPKAYPPDRRWTFSARPLLGEVTTQHRQALVFLFAGAGCLLVLVTLNVVNLVLSSHALRDREFEVRAALGASRGNLVSQLFAEGLIIGLAGGIAGLGASPGFLAMLLPLVPAHIPRLDAIAIGWNVAAFAVAVGVGLGLVVGACSTLRRGLGRAGLSGTTTRATANARLHRTLGALVVTEVAVSVLLLTGAGLMTRTIWRLSLVEPGFSPAEVLTTRIALPRVAYPDAPSLERFFDAAVTQLATLPGVDAVGAVRRLPMATRIGRWTLRTSRDRSESVQAQFQVVTPGYFEAVRIPLVSGRSLTPNDRRGAPGVVIISAAMAARYWPGRDPVGQEIRLDGHPGNPWVTVAGVVGDVRHNSLTDAAGATVYLPFDQAVTSAGPFMETPAMNLVLRSRLPPEVLEPLVRSRLRAIDPALPLGPSKTLQDVLDQSNVEPRFLSRLLTVFSVVAVTLVYLGVHGLLMLVVRQRTAEIGIRVAVGAGPRQVTRLVLGRVLSLAGMGAAAGTLTALASGQTIASFLFEVTARDPLTLAGSVVVVGVAAVAGGIVPLRRALTIDPAAALHLR